MMKSVSTHCDFVDVIFIYDNSKVNIIVVVSYNICLQPRVMDLIER